MVEESDVWGTSGWPGWSIVNPMNMKVLTSWVLSERSFFIHMTMSLHFSVSSAYSRRVTNPSLDPSGSRATGTCMYRQCWCKSVSHLASVRSVNLKIKESFTLSPRSTYPSNSLSSTLLLTESVSCFPTPLPSVLDSDNDDTSVNEAVWGASGIPLRPHTQADAVMRRGHVFF